MMFGGMAAMLGAAVLVTWCTVLLGRANPDERVTLFRRRPTRAPWTALALNVGAVVLSSIGMVFFPDEFDPWPLATLLVLVPGPLVAQTCHNRRTARQHEGNRSGSPQGPGPG